MQIYLDYNLPKFNHAVEVFVPRNELFRASTEFENYPKFIPKYKSVEIISKVDLLKMDCKGCEFFLNEKSLEKVKRIKIEYVAMDSSHKLKDLLKTLEKMKFKYMIYRIEPFNYTSNKMIGHIYGKKIT